jgi:FKBP-type peptidyl-prolyl cis-trans isomerase
MNDSLLFTSEGKTEPLLSLVARPIYDGDPWEIFTMLGAGDSASCKVPAKNIFKNHLPASLQPTDPIKLDVKVIAVYSAQQYDSLKMAAVNAQLNREDQAFQTYLRKNGLQGTKTPSGMYIAITTPGKGKQATQGSTVLVDYTGKLMNGEQFDSSMQPGREPYEVVIGQSSVIQGWHEGLTYFNTGAKGQILIPSRLAYGERGNPPRIGSNEPLVFEIEMVEVR